MTILSEEVTIILILGGLLVFLLIWVVRLEIKLHNFLKGQSGKSLENTILSTKKDVNELESFRRGMEEYLKNVEKRLKRSIQNVDTVRFNPFRGSGEGGNQSFATSFLNEKGNGVVISSLYARERMSVFAKPVKKYTSDFELTDEEKQVISSAEK